LFWIATSSPTYAEALRVSSLHGILAAVSMTQAEIVRLSSRDKVVEVFNRAVPLLPADARDILLSMLRPESIGLIAGTLVVWGGSHFFGIGEVVDVVLLGVGVAVLGLSAIDGASEFCDFVNGTLNARSDAELNKAAQHFSRAAVILGISTLQAVLLRGQARAQIARGRPQIRPRSALVGSAPPAGNQLRVARPATLPNNTLGVTDAYCCRLPKSAEIWRSHADARLPRRLACLETLRSLASLRR
jgi:hypothetical protein